jgi:hypothetical protein
MHLYYGKCVRRAISSGSSENKLKETFVIQSYLLPLPSVCFNFVCDIKIYVMNAVCQTSGSRLKYFYCL